MRGLLPIGILAMLSGDPALAQDPLRCGELPEPVAATRERIAATASEGDLAAMAALADHDDFVYSFGDGGDPLAYWRELADDGTDVRTIIATLVAMDCSVIESDEGPYFTWQAAADLPFAELTADEREALAALYNDDVESVYVEGTETGYYVGWRLMLAGDGRWIAFVAGD